MGTRLKLGVCLCAAGVVALGVVSSFASEPRSVAGTWERVGDADFLLRDPFTSQPVALVGDPSWRLTSSGSGIIHGPMTAMPPGLPVLTAGDRSPEFWAEPVAWNYFGPARYSGMGRDAAPRDFAGRPAFDRRGYALDPGWRVQHTLAPPTSTGSGKIQIALIPGTVGLQFRTQSGRVYVIEYTSSLSRPFEPVRTISSLVEEDVSITLPTDTTQGFYRVAEQVY